MDGVITRFHANTDDKVAIERVQDCTAIMEHAKRLQAAGEHGSREFRHVASVPVVIVEKYIQTHGITFAEFMRDQKHHANLLNDPDLSFFRVSPERV